MTAIERIKSVQRGLESLVLVVDDIEAQRVMIAWTYYRPAVSDYSPGKKETVEAMAARLWAKVSPVDFKKLGALASVPASRCESAFYRLKMAGLVYPDGTISGPATDLLRGQITARIKGLIPKRRTP